MQKKFLFHQDNKLTSSNEAEYRNIILNSKKVDINVLLNRVKLNNVKEKKKNIFFMLSTIFGICLSAYIVFN